MYCFMCSSFTCKLQKFQSDMDIFEKITFVLPDLAIPKSKDSVFICVTCLEEVSFFYTIKNESLQNCGRLKHFNTLLKGIYNIKYNDLNITIKSGELSTQCERLVKIKFEPNHEELFLSEEIDIKEEEKEYDHYSPQLENYESNFMDINKLTEKDSNLTLDGSSYNSEPNSQPAIEKKRFKCNDCKKTFISRRDLERHIRVHTGEKPYQCSTCQKTFARSAHLNTHTLTHTGEKPHECDVCHKTFTQIGHLISHKRCHTNVKPFKCTMCDKTFTVSSSLSRHVRTHTGQKPYQCQLCPFKCSVSDTLQVHIRGHTGDRPYICEICQKSFITSSNLNKHKLKTHIKEEPK